MAMFYIRDADEASFDMFVVADDFDRAIELWHMAVQVNSEYIDRHACTAYRLTYHKFGPNEVIPWNEFERKEFTSCVSI